MTEEGLSVAKDPSAQVNVAFLKKYETFRVFHESKSESAPSASSAAASSPELTPQETIEEAFSQYKRELADELLTLVKSCTPTYFERIVLDVLIAMGYGGGDRTSSGIHLGKSGDEGIDGVIRQDRLGLEMIYIQAKRWEGSVSRPVVQTFAGALQGQKARKGVLITTSTFTKEATEFVRHLENRIVLVDGPQLAELMIQFGVGVSDQHTYQLRRVDSDYFVEG